MSLNKLSYYQLVELRKKYVKQVEPFDEFLNKYKDESLTNLDYETIDIKLNRITKTEYECEQIQSRIEALCTEKDPEYQIGFKFEEQLDKAISKAKFILNSYNRLHLTNSNRETNKSNENVKLPVMELPAFSGKLTQWRPFEDSFNALIHRNSSLS